VNCIMAGPFFTDVSRSWDIPAFEQRAQAHALRRGGDPAEIVGAALYFASDASSFTTGRCWPSTAACRSRKDGDDGGEQRARHRAASFCPGGRPSAHRGHMPATSARVGCCRS